MRLIIQHNIDPKGFNCFPTEFGLIIDLFPTFFGMLNINYEEQNYLKSIIKNKLYNEIAIIRYVMQNR